MDKVDVMNGRTVNEVQLGGTIYEVELGRIRDEVDVCSVGPKTKLSLAG